MTQGDLKIHFNFVTKSDIIALSFKEKTNLTRGEFINMKKMYGLLSILGLTMILAACQGDEPITFEPVIVPGFEMSLETTINFEEVENQMRAVLEELPYPLTELDEETLTSIYESIEVPEQLFTFNLVLLSAEFDADFEDEAPGAPMPTNDLIQVDTEGTVTFEDITFTNAGIFVYRISQLIQDDEADQWQLDWDNEHDMTVTITEDKDLETLVATINHTEISFVNEYIPDVTEALLVIFNEQWEEMIELAYLEGYEYILNDDNTYERVAIYVADVTDETNDPESGTNDTPGGTASNSTNTNNNVTTSNTGSTNNTTNNASTNNNTNNQTNNNSGGSANNNTSNNTATTPNTPPPPASGNNSGGSSTSGGSNTSTNTPPPANPTPPPAPTPTPAPPPPPQRPVDILDQNHIMSTLRAYGQNNRGATMVGWEDAQRSLGFIWTAQTSWWGSNVTNQLMINSVQDWMSGEIDSTSYFHLEWRALDDGNVIIVLWR